MHTWTRSLRRAAAALGALAVVAVTSLVGVSPAAAEPGPTVTITASASSIAAGQSVTFTTNAPNGSLAVLFLDGVNVGQGAAEELNGNAFQWGDFGSCQNAVLTARVYDEVYDDVDDDMPYATQPLDSVDVTFLAADCSVTASVDRVAQGEGVVFTTEAPSDNLAAFFIDGEPWNFGSVVTTPNPFGWDLFEGDITCEDVMATYRVYNMDADDWDEVEVPWDEPYAATVDVTFAGTGEGCESTPGGGSGGGSGAGTGSGSTSGTGSNGKLAQTGGELTAVPAAIALTTLGAALVLADRRRRAATSR